jgi:hypothetical protein
MIHVRELLERHADRRVLVIGEYIGQVEAIAMEIGPDRKRSTGSLPYFHAVA